MEVKLFLNCIQFVAGCAAMHFIFDGNILYACSVFVGFILLQVSYVLEASKEQSDV
jgi:hypothetical protein